MRIKQGYNMKKKLLALLVLPGIFVACNSTSSTESDTEESSSSMQESSSSITTTDLTYANDISPLIQSYCAGCHSGDEPAKGLDLTTYANVSGAASAINNRVVTMKNMPPAKASSKPSDAEREKIREWIAGGTPE